MLDITITGLINGAIPALCWDACIPREDSTENTMQMFKAMMRVVLGAGLAMALGMACTGGPGGTTSTTSSSGGSSDGGTSADGGH